MDHWLKKYISIENICLIGVILLAIFFRFYNTPARYGFDFDPTRDALAILYGASHLQFPLIGARSGIAPVTFGPWYYYQLILFQIIFPFAYSPWFFVSLTSIGACYLMYKTGELLENKWFGLLLGFFMAISPSETGQTQGLSNPDLIPFYSTLTIYFFVKFFKHKPSLLLLFIWASAISIGINVHYQLLGLFILPILFFLLRREDVIKRISVFIIGFFIPCIPLILFNLQFHWHTLKGIQYFVQHHPYVPNNWHIYIFDFWLPFWSYIFGFTNVLTVVSICTILVVFLYVCITKKVKEIYVLLGVALIIDFIFFRYIIAQREYYYYLFIHGFIFILFGFALWRIHEYRFGKLIVVVVTIGVAYSMIFSSNTAISLHTRSEQVMMQDEAGRLIRQYPGEMLTLYSCNDVSQNIAQGVDFFLLKEGKLSESGGSIRIGLIDSGCQHKFLTNLPFSTIQNATSLQKTSDSMLIQSGWKRITPETVYDDTFTWWEHS